MVLTAVASLLPPFPQKRRGSAADPISEDDLLRAIDKLKVLGGGFGVVRIGAKQFVRSVPTELTTDTNAVIELAQVTHEWARGWIQYAPTVAG